MGQAKKSENFGGLKGYDILHDGALNKSTSFTLEGREQLGLRGLLPHHICSSDIHQNGLGDCALVPNAYDGKLSPPTAQFADRQAKVLAKNIVAKLSGNDTKPFTYKPAGMLASVGHNKAVADVYGVQFSGLIAFLMWRGIYLLKVPTLSRKMRLFLEWTWAMFFPPDIAHLGFKRTGEK